ncbi:MAG: SpoIIE family protein phosphatase [Ignavibacteriales bacterium]|nr:SpoIIE family protein phosphatase [Ignavibacteriales bacterium]
MIFNLRHIQVYRTLIALFAAVLFIFSWITFYRFISLPTDENIFRDVDAKLMAAKNFYGEIIGKRPSIGTQPQSVQTYFDSLMTGDLILTINGGDINTIKDAYESIYDSPSNEVRIEVLRPSLNYELTFKLDRSKITQDLFALLPKYVFIADVTQGGASDRAGLKVGDLIIRINNEEFNSAVDADRIMRLGQIGKSLKYDILRNNRIMEVNLVLATFGIPISILIFCLSGFVFMAIGFFIAFSRPNILGARLIGLGFLWIGYFMTVVAVRRDFIPNIFTISRDILMGGGYVIGIAFLFHAFHYFPIERPELTSRKWIVRGYYTSSAISAALSLWLNNPYPFLILPLFGLYILLKHRKFASDEYRRLNKVIQWSSATVGAVSIVTLIFFQNQLGIFGSGFYGILLLVIPLSYLYTIGRYRLLDIKFRVRRNTQYSLLTAVWSIIVFYLLVWIFFMLPQIDFPNTNIVFTGASIEVSDSPELASERVSSERVLLMLLAIGVTFVFMKVRLTGQRFIDKKYFRMQYDYRKAQQDLGEILATTLSMEDLSKRFVQKLSELMRLKLAGVVFFRDESCCTCEAAFGFNGEQWKNFCVSHESVLIPAIKQFHNEIRIQYLPPQIKEEFHREGFQYLIPIRSKERLIGAILVGEKQAETTFQQEDLSFLSTAAKQASVAIENAFLYEELAEKERMKHELDIARRIQLDSLPQSTPNIVGLDIAGTSIPAMEVGGDFYDYLQNENAKLTIVIGDFSGKGTSAALYMSKVQGILRSLHGFDLSPRDLFTRANKLLCQDLEKRSFVTVLGAEFDNKNNSMVVARAGHLPLWHYDAKRKTVHKVIPKGLGLGLNDAGVFVDEMEEKKIGYGSGDVFLFATDGVTDARNSSGDYGDERLHEVLVSNVHRSANEIQEMILQSIENFVGDYTQYDDQTVVVVKVQ